MPRPTSSVSSILTTLKIATGMAPSSYLACRRGVRRAVQPVERGWSSPAPALFDINNLFLNLNVGAGSIAFGQPNEEVSSPRRRALRHAAAAAELFRLLRRHGKARRLGDDTTLVWLAERNGAGTDVQIQKQIVDIKQRRRR